MRKSSIKLMYFWWHLQPTKFPTFHCNDTLHHTHICSTIPNNIVKLRSTYSFYYYCYFRFSCVFQPIQSVIMLPDMSYGVTYKYICNVLRNDYDSLTQADRQTSRYNNTKQSH